MGEIAYEMDGSRRLFDQARQYMLGRTVESCRDQHFNFYPFTRFHLLDAGLPAGDGGLVYSQPFSRVRLLDPMKHAPSLEREAEGCGARAGGIRFKFGTTIGHSLL